MSLNVAYNPFECCKYQPHENTLIQLIKDICIPDVGCFSSWVEKGRKRLYFEMPTWLCQNFQSNPELSLTVQVNAWGSKGKECFELL